MHVKLRILYCVKHFSVLHRLRRFRDFTNSFIRIYVLNEISQINVDFKTLGS